MGPGILVRLAFNVRHKLFHNGIAGVFAFERIPMNSDGQLVLAGMIVVLNLWLFGDSLFPNNR
jgi:hypothetical protein